MIAVDVDAEDGNGKGSGKGKEQKEGCNRDHLDTALQVELCQSQCMLVLSVLLVSDEAELLQHLQMHPPHQCSYHPQGVELM